MTVSPITRKHRSALDLAATLALVAAVVLAGCTGPPASSTQDLPGQNRLPTLACPLPCARVIDSGARWEPSVAVDPTNPLHIVATSSELRVESVTGEERIWGLAHVSFDGGATWSTSRLPGGASAGPVHPLFRYNAMTDGVAGFLPDGTPFVSEIAYVRYYSIHRPQDGALGALTLVFFRSSDEGRSFPEFTVVREGSGFYADGPIGAYLPSDWNDKQGLAVGRDGRILMAWSEIDGGNPPSSTPIRDSSNIVASTSTDGGRTWSPITTVAKGGRLSGASPIIRDDAAWVVAYTDLPVGNAHVAISSDEGASWNGSTLGPSTTMPALAKGTGPRGERLFLVTPATTEGREAKQTPTLQWSDDGGVSWSDPLALAIIEAPGRTVPALAATPDGSAFVTFYAPQEGKPAEFRAVAVRNGLVSEALVLDSTTRNPGDYQGLAPIPGGGAFAVWNARQDDDSASRVAGARLEIR